MNKYNILDRSYEKYPKSKICFSKKKTTFTSKNMFLKDNYKNLDVFIKKNYDKK